MLQLQEPDSNLLLISFELRSLGLFLFAKQDDLPVKISDHQGSNYQSHWHRIDFPQLCLLLEHLTFALGCWGLNETRTSGRKIRLNLIMQMKKLSVNGKALNLNKFYQLPAACNNSSNVASLRSDASTASVSVMTDDTEHYDEEYRSSLIYITN